MFKVRRNGGGCIALGGGGGGGGYRKTIDARVDRFLS